MYRRTVRSFSLAIILCWACAWGGEDGTPAPVRITLLHINDAHGHLEAFTEGGRQAGGYARLATLVDQVRAEKKADRVFLLHAGDEFSRGDELTTKTLGAANIAVLNHLKFDFWTPGNGDFYWGDKVLLERIHEGRFYTLAANVSLRTTGRCIAAPQILESVGPVTVAFFGLCTVRTGLPSAAGLRVEEPLATAARLVPELRRQANLVILVSHLGVDEDKRLAAQVEGLDVIIGAHTHTVLQHGLRIQNPAGQETLLAQAGEFLKYLGRLDLRLEQRAGRWQVAESTARLIPVDDQVKLDTTVTGLIARLSAAAEPVAAQPAEAPAVKAK